MQTRIIKARAFSVTGLTGDGNQTARLWEEFDKSFNAASFDRADENGYEVRFDYDGKCDCHVGFAARDSGMAGFTTLELLATDYAVFDVLVANGYESENEAVNAWLRDNCDEYEEVKLGGKAYAVEVYGERFNGGNMPDSIVELWIPIREVQ